MRVVIIGNGVAGIEAALTVRNREPDWPITIISEESDHFFSRTALMWVFTGQLSHQCIEPHERDLYGRMKFERVRARAVGVDTEARAVKMAGGLADVPYDRLVIACGSRPRPGPWPGSDLEGVGHFVTLQDLEWFETEVHGHRRRGRPPNPEAHLAATTDDSPYRPRPTARDRRRGRPAAPAVIGGGLIGIEAVEVMVAAKLKPRFFIREDWFWPIALNDAEAEWIGDRMSEHGVQMHLKENVETLNGDGGAIKSIKTDRGEYPCDLTVVAIGVVPNTDWLAGSPITRQERGGAIEVNDRLETNVPGVFAAGDCAAVKWFDGTQRPEQLWYTSRDQGRIAGRGVLGDTATYERGLWYNSAKLMDIEWTTVGLVNMNIENEQNWYFEEKGSVRSTTRIVMSGDRVVGFNLLGRRWDHEILLDFVREHRPLDHVLKHLNEATFDTEFVPRLKIPAEAARAPLSGPAFSTARQVNPAPVV